MDDKILTNSRVYTDIQSLKQLGYEYHKNPQAVKKEVTKQFEAFLVQMMLRSMRDANKAFAPDDDLMGGEQMDFYQDMFDKQLSLLLPDLGIGFDKSLNMKDKSSADRSLATQTSPGASAVPLPFTPTAVNTNLTQIDEAKDNTQNSSINPNITRNTKETFSSPETFVNSLWPSAKTAAKMLGVSPTVLLAQAALETNWGKNIMPHADGSPSYNLFGIKADDNWNKKSTVVDTLEQENGIMVKIKAKFRSYETFLESFMDYVHLLKSNSRYSQALEKAANPKAYLQALQEAGYATDQHYARKIYQIYSSNIFQALTAKLR